MKKEQIIYIAFGLVAGIILTLFGQRQNGANPRFGMSFTSSGIDKHFIEQMIPHHESAIEMSRLAQQKSKNPEILTLASSIMLSQSNEITQMKAWYKSWYGVDVPANSDVSTGMGRGMMHGGMMGGNTADTDLLKNSNNFDEDFLREMIPHHQMAVMMAQMLLSGTSRSEMKQLANDIISAQEKEITQMRSWLLK